MPIHADARAVGRMIDELAEAILTDARRLDPDARHPIVVIGIRTRGHTLADRLARSLNARRPTSVGRGVLDITLYRDDLSEIGPRPLVRPTVLQTPIDDARVILVDDVLYTGRSVRAALDAFADFGRPRVIRLAVLADRGGRELPIHPDWVGIDLGDVPATCRVNVHLVETDGVDEIVVEPRLAADGATPSGPVAGDVA